MDVIDFLPDATLAINLDGKVIAWNRAIEEMTGVTASEMLGQGDYGYVVPFCGNRRPILIDFVLKPDRKGEKDFSVVREHRDLLRMEWVGRLKGKKACLWCKASPLYDNDGNIVGAIESIRDITELRRKEKELEIKAGELQDLNAALRVLLKQRDGDRGELEDKILANIKQLVLPLPGETAAPDGRTGPFLPQGRRIQPAGHHLALRPQADGEPPGLDQQGDPGCQPHQRREDGRRRFPRS